MSPQATSSGPIPVHPNSCGAPMRNIHVRASSTRLVIEVDGDLDVVGGYDLSRSVELALRDGRRRIAIDLSRVLSMDAAGVSRLRQCAQRAVRVGAVSSLEACSRPALQALRKLEGR
jgi:anti-anti-sigma factor